MTKNDKVKLYTKNRIYMYGAIRLVYKNIAHWDDEFSKDALGEMLSIIGNCRSLKKKKINTPQGL